MNFLRNIIVNLKATGPAAVIIAWILGVTCLGIFGQGQVAEHGMTALNLVGVILIIAMAQRM